MGLIDKIKSTFSENITQISYQQGDPLVYLKREGAAAVLRSLKDDADFKLDVLMDLFAVDYLHWEEKADRFEIVYNLYSTSMRHRLFVKVSVPEKDAALDSVASVWPAANWFEREAWDMFGVKFKGHPDPRRILMYEEFTGHALRKDYPYNKRQPLIGPMN